MDGLGIKVIAGIVGTEPVLGARWLRQGEEVRFRVVPLGKEIAKKGGEDEKAQDENTDGG